MRGLARGEKGMLFVQGAEMPGIFQLQKKTGRWIGYEALY